MMMKKKIIFVGIPFVVFLSGFVFLFCLYRTAMATGLPGRKNGPQDAFRHTLGSALTAKYISPRFVEFITVIAERDDNSQPDLMDRHNNAIGIQLGISKDKNISENLYEAVTKKVSEGKIDSQDPNITRWLPEDKWTNGL